MDADMVAMFPNGIRALMIDDDTKFLKSATTLLSVLNFDVVRCSSVAHALKSLTSGGLIGFDVILVHAANATTCGFDFRAIVETDLLIPVIYFLEEDYGATGDEANELLRMLQAPGSYIIKKPLDIDEVRTRLWTVIAFRKCDLQTKASRGGGAGDEGGRGDDEDRVHFKVVTKGRGWKRKGGNSSKHGGSTTAAAAATGGRPAAKGKEKENVSSQQQQNDGRAKKAQKNGGCEAYNLPQSNTTMMNGQTQQHVQHQPNPSDLLMQSFLRMLAVPPNNPKFFMNAIVPMPSYNPMLSPPPAAPTMAAAATAAYEPPQFSHGISNKQHQQQDDVHPLLIFGPFPYQGPTPSSPPVVEQDILAPAAAGDRPFTGSVAGGGMTGGASQTAAATEAVAYINDVSLPFLQAPNHGAQQEGAKELAGMVGMDIMYSRMTPPMAPQHVISNANGFINYSTGSSFVVPEIAEQDGDGELAGLMGTDLSYASMADPHPPSMLPQHTSDDASAGKAKMLDLLFNDDYNAGSSAVTPDDVDQVPGMALSLNELTTLAGGAFGSNNVVPLMASQGQGTGTAVMEGDDDAAGHKEAMLPYDQYEDDDNTSFPLDALLGDLHGPMFELDDDDDLEVLPAGDSTGGGAAATDDGAGTSLIPGEEGGGMNGLSNLAGIDIPHDIWHLNDLASPQPRNKNNFRE